MQRRRTSSWPRPSKARRSTSTRAPSTTIEVKACGSDEMLWRGVFLVVAVIGVILGFPVPVLTLVHEGAQRVVGLDDGDRFVYSYINSVYDAPVDERQMRADDRL